MQRPVIALAGPPGSGKSSVAKGLVTELSKIVPRESVQQIAHLDLDDYQNFTNESIEDIEQWQKNSGDYNDFVINQLPEDLRKLKAGTDIQPPNSGHPLQTCGPIILETHFGRAHQATGQFIDYLVWLNLPLDIALARNIKGFCQDFREDPDHHPQQINWLSEYIDNYLSTVHLSLQSHSINVSKDADLCVETQQPLDVVIAEIMTQLHKVFNF